jgi:hypothetical protein
MPVKKRLRCIAARTSSISSLHDVHAHAGVQLGRQAW